AADNALHFAKREGGNRICVYQQQGQLYTPVAGESSERRGSNRPRSERPVVPPPATSRPPARISGRASDRPPSRRGSE
ncbi:MAG TPA: diguanylate cyclase response regulator, partial [Polyangiaceae bacterium]|nr:diguanylate cyclase response regulator [Polyangiaceae bacterium]